MTREEKCELAISRGYTYNPETGIIYNRLGKISSYTGKTGYITICITLNKKSYIIKGHQFGWYYINNECVKILDHINGIKNDNRICNLRSVTSQQNQFNKKAKGYHWSKSKNKWKAEIGINFKTIFLGYFNTEIEAQIAYLEAKQKYHVI